ncbi:glycosyltransferase family 4 protein [Massilia timonae]|uniref:glycosyltransferase family 4 protein n=1 Tax=Massilia timonae TaxID=47229 RepID=UPI0028AC4EC0|nr:glycosyltransferase family 1 protein [Massilia timonae]
MNTSGLQIAGNIDVVDTRWISGWYYSESQTNPLLRFYAEGILLTETIANLERADVKEYGYPTSLCGFQATIPFLEKSPKIIEVEDVGLGKKIWEIDFQEKRAMNSLLTGQNQTPTKEPSNNPRPQDGSKSTLRLLFDVSDLVYYLGHHDNLTGIQRVQSSVIQAIFSENLLPKSQVDFICFDAHQKKFKVIDQRSFISLLLDLSLPVEQRQINFDRMKARAGSLFAGGDLMLTPADGERTVISLLGAAWVIPDYVRTILNIKRKFGVRFVPTFHDLIPIYAKETCDQGTAEVFKGFLDQIIRHVDVALCVSENTSRDLRRYCEENNLPLPPTHVTKNGSSLSEFFATQESDSSIDEIVPNEPYALFVSTIEGRKNHIYAFQIWQTLIKSGVKMPKLVCVGRLGWRAEEFLQSLLRTNNLDGHIEIVEDISDAELEALYRNCKFTVYPSLYEGWGLPIGESLAYGKPCILANGSSLPEVAGDLGIYIPLDNVDAASQIVRDLVENPNALETWTERVQTEYHPVRWADVAKEVIAGCQLALREPRKNLYPCFELGKEYLFRQVRVNTQGRMGQSMLQGLLEANQRIILNGQATPEERLYGLESRSGSWYDPEGWGCWTDGTKANLNISLDLVGHASENLCIYLAFQIPGQYIPCDLTLKIAGTIVGAPQAVKSSSDIKRWVIPAKLIKEKSAKKFGSSTLVDIEFSLTNIPLTGFEKLSSVDSRQLGLGVKSILLSSESDIATRCAVLEKLIFNKGI